MLSPTKDEALALSPIAPSETPSPASKDILQKRHYQHRLQQLDGTAFNDGEDIYAHRASRNQPHLPANYHGANSTAQSTRENSRSNSKERKQGGPAHINGQSNELGRDGLASKDTGFNLPGTGPDLGVDFSKDVPCYDGSISGACDGNGSSAQSLSHSQKQKDIIANLEINQSVWKPSSSVSETTRSIRSPFIETDLYDASIQPRRSTQVIEPEYRTTESDPFGDPHIASSIDEINPISVTVDSANSSTSNTDTDTEALREISPVFDRSNITPYVFLGLQPPLSYCSMLYFTNPSSRFA